MSIYIFDKEAYDEINASLSDLFQIEITPIEFQPVAIESIARSTAASGEMNAFYGQRHTTESIALIKEARKKQVMTAWKWSDESKEKARKSHLGKTLSDCHRQKIGAGRKGKVMQSTCPHCGKTGSAIAMGRWHFDNCKEKK